MNLVASFHAAGLPKPQGSKRGFAVAGKVRLVESGGAAHKDWRATVTAAAKEAMGHQAPVEGPLRVELTFFLPRPKSHPKTRRTWPVARPDVDKLARSCLDSMTHVLWRDDSQVVELEARKTWAYAPDVGAERPAGVQVLVQRLAV